MIRFGAVGTNWITEEMLAGGLHLQDFKLTAVYSRTEEKAREFANKHEAEYIFTNLEEMAKSKKIDAVYIATPNSLHMEQSLIFLRNGVHVLCEKPIASNPAELKMMIETANEHNVLLMEALKTTFLPNFSVIKDHIGKVGKVRRCVVNYCKYSSRYDAYREGTVLNAFKPELSNGSLMDLGIYCIYPMVTLFGEPLSVQANAVMLESGVDGSGSLILEYDDFEVVITHSKIVDAYGPSEIQGEDGTIVIDLISTPSHIELHERKGPSTVISVEDIYPSMYYEVKEFIQLLKDGKTESKINSHEYSLITANILAEARKQIGLIFPADKQK